MAILLIIVALWLINDVIDGYKAARHAQKAVYNRDLSIIDYMVVNHPIMAVCIALLVLLAVISMATPHKCQKPHYTVGAK